MLNDSHFLFFVLFPAGVLFLELLIVGWEHSSLRVLAHKGRSTGADWLYYALDALKVNGFFVAVASVGVFAYFAKHNITLNALASVPPVAQFIVGFIAADFCAYWTHRALHAVPLLWEFHKVHHSATKLNILMTFRFHPMEKLVWHLEAMTVFLVMGASPKTFALFVAVDVFLGQIQHARLSWDYGPIGKLLISPTFHRLHHSTDPQDYNRNFGGRLTIWDRMFRTHSDRDIPFDSIGLGETQPVVEEFIAPFKHLFNCLSRHMKKQTSNS